MKGHERRYVKCTEDDVYYTEAASKENVKNMERLKADAKHEMSVCRAIRLPRRLIGA